MVIYISFLLIPVILMFVMRKREDRNRITLIVSFCILFIVLSIRSRYTGVDLLAYESMYERMKGVSFKSLIQDFRILRRGYIVGTEWGYELFTWIFSALNLDFQWLLAAHAAICLGSAYYMIRKNSTNPVLSFALLVGFGFFDYTYCILRQALSIAILMYATETIKNRKPLLFILLVYIASLFHTTALLFVLAYPLSYIPITRKTIAAFCIISASIVVAFPFAVRPLLEKFVAFTGSGWSYLNYTFEFKEMPLLILLITGFLAVFMNQTIQFEDKEKTFFWTFMLTLPIEALSMYMPIFSRFSTMTLFPFASIAIPNLLETNENRKLVYVFEILIYIAAVAYYAVCLHFDLRELCITPYATIFG